MVFKRRDKRSVTKIVADGIYPKGGWTRAFHYVKHRLRRLPGTPEFIARGIWAGVFTTYCPFYGMHFLVAALIARVINGNLLAALLGTFFGNPLTYLPIGMVSLKTGHFLLGTEFHEGAKQSLASKFANAGADLWHNFVSMFTDSEMDWTGLSVFFEEVFFPYLVGGIIPGIITATIAYYLTVPVIRAYQKRRAARFRKKVAAAQAKAQKAAAKHQGNLPQG